MPTNPQPLISQRKTRGVLGITVLFFYNSLFKLPDGKKGIGFKIPSIQVFNFIFIFNIHLPLRSASCRKSGKLFLFEILVCKSSWFAVKPFIIKISFMIFISLTLHDAGFPRPTWFHGWNHGGLPLVLKRLKDKGLGVWIWNLLE